ncbi:MAG: methionine gamma-lyase family protein [Eubacterium sp.]|nr:methionine gamma-lyase family protein [Eubacterium sp.]
MSFFKIDERLKALAEKAEQLCAPSFEQIRRTAEYNGEKVLAAFINNGVAEMHLKGTTGYGYNDVGRDKLDEVFAEAMGCEAALVRHSFVNGTHALSTALFGVLRPGDTLLCVTGKPYDTLSEVIFGDYGGSLKEFGVKYAQIDLLPDGTPDYEKIKAAAGNAKVIYIQRSRGYSLRPSLCIDTIEKIVKAVREVNDSGFIMVDNCYGEFAETREPTDVGADLIIGSLIKNPGGGIAKTGGYIAGQSGLVELCSYRLTTVGTGAEVGCSLDENREMLLGFFLSPQTVESALKTSVFACAFFELLGYEVFPRYDEKRTDIIAALKLGNPDALCAFCRGIQKGSPVDSMAAPEPWDMPGYDSQVIMAAGAFTMGASIELSADAPLREPYAVWLQGGLTYPTGKTGILLAAQSMLDGGLIKL